MTEYTTSSEAIREYLSSRERTAMWVQRHTRPDDDVNLLSPSVPPSIISDSDAPSYGPTDSDDESDRSLPPRMVLRYGDGRPDITISTEYHPPRARSYSNPIRQGSRAPSTVHHHGPGGDGLLRQPVAQNPSQHPRYAQTLSYASGPILGPDAQAGVPAPPSPEHILILPSPQGEEPPNMGPNHPVPRSATVHSARPENIIPTGVAPSHQPSQHTIHAPTPHRGYNASHASRNDTHSPPVTYSHSHPPAGPHGNARHQPHTSRPGTALPYTYSPPQIIYAPSSRNPNTRYAPPQIVYSPPSRTHRSQSQSRGPAPGITYSHSDPLPESHNNPYFNTLPRNAQRGVLIEEDSSGSDNARGHGHGARHNRERSGTTGSSRGRPRGRIPIDRSPSETPPLSDAGSRTSGSTYYVLPTPGQKVQIIQPGAPSLHTATTSTKASSNPSPNSVHHPRNIFQKIFSIPRFAGSVDSRGSSRSQSSTRRLQRRHTLGGAHLQQ